MWRAPSALWVEILARLAGRGRGRGRKLMELMKAMGPIDPIGLMEPTELMELMKLMWPTELLGSMKRAWRSAAAQ